MKAKKLNEPTPENAKIGGYTYIINMILCVAFGIWHMNPFSHRFAALLVTAFVSYAFVYFSIKTCPKLSFLPPTITVAFYSFGGLFILYKQFF